MQEEKCVIVTVWSPMTAPPARARADYDYDYLIVPPQNGFISDFRFQFSPFFVGFGCSFLEPKGWCWVVFGEASLQF